MFGGYGSSGPAKMKLFETDESDVEIHHDLFIPFPKEVSEGIRMVFEHWLEIYLEGDDLES